MKTKLLEVLFILSCIILAGMAVAGGYALVRIYWIDQFVIPTGSMSPTLQPGDRIWVNKRIAGARIYDSFDFSDTAALCCHRTDGRRSVRVNDVVVFNHPYGQGKRRIGFRINHVYAKRCIGCPGDSVGVCGGWYVNNNYDGVIGDSLRQSVFSKVNNEEIDERVRRPGWLRGIDTTWTIHDCGPIYVPKKGETIRMDSATAGLYGYLVRWETDKQLRTDGDIVCLGEEPVTAYTFTHDYYFFCGDNIADSNDSRNWGFVPDDFIVGVVTRIAFSRNPRTGRSDPARFMLPVSRK